MFQTAGSGVALVGFNLIENHGSRFGLGVGGGGLSSPLRLRGFLVRAATHRQARQKKHHISAASEEPLMSQKRSKGDSSFMRGTVMTSKVLMVYPAG